MHLCKPCGQSLPLTPEHFHRSNHFKTGFQVICKKCVAAWHKTPEFREWNRTYMRAYRARKKAEENAAKRHRVQPGA